MQGVLKLKKNNSDAKRLIIQLQGTKYGIFPLIIYGPNILSSNYLAKQLGPILTLASY